MAAILTTLEAVNQLLEVVRLKPVSALDTGGHSEAGQAERFLDEASRRVQLQGGYSNRILSKEYTAASTKVALATDVLAIKSAGRTGHRNFTIRYVSSEPRVYDLDNETAVFTNGEKIYLDVTYLVSFANCDPTLQLSILDDARERFLRFYKSDQWANEQVQLERARAEMNRERSTGRAPADRSNPQPFAIQPGGKS